MVIRLRIWLAAMAIIVIGCAGQSLDDGSPDERDASAVDASRDRSPGASDGVVSRDGGGNDGDGPSVVSPDGDAQRTDGGGIDNAADRLQDVSLDAPDATSAPDVSPFDVIDASAETRPDIADARGGDVVADISADAHDLSVDSDAHADDAHVDDSDAGGPPDGSGSDANDDPPAFDVDAGVDGCTAVTCGLVSLAVTPSSSFVIQHMTQWMRAWGTYIDFSTRELTNDVVWATAPSDVALISNAASRKGLLTTVYPGQTTVTAALGSVSGSTTVSIGVDEPRVLEITPPLASVAQGTQVQLRGLVTTGTGFRVDWTSGLPWTSSAPNVATVTSEGLVTGLAPGVTTIGVNTQLLVASTTLTVTAATLSSLSIAPATVTLPVGPVKPLRLIGTFSNVSTQDLTAFATWGSSDIGRVTVSDAAGTKGNVTGVTPGSATVNAAFGGMSASATIDVSAAVLSSIASLAVPASRLMLLMRMRNVALGHYSDGSSFDITGLVSWSSSDAAVVEVSGPEMTARGEGTSQIVGTYGGAEQRFFVEVRAGVLDRIEIVPNPVAVAPGATADVHATGFYADGSSYDLTWFAGWTTADPNMAWATSTFSLPTRLRGVTGGTTDLRASWAGRTGSAVVNVSAANAARALMPSFGDGHRGAWGAK